MSLILNNSRGMDYSEELRISTMIRKTTMTSIPKRRTKIRKLRRK